MDFTKRLFDLTVSIILLPFALVLIVLFGMVFWVTTSENPIFSQTRIGINKRQFRLYKLRTMGSSVTEIPTHLLDKAEIPFVGRLMRASKVDELPQLINVIFGEMSLVGPRPCLSSQKHIIRSRAENGIFGLLPGITGLAQIRGVDMSDKEALLREDLYYKNHRSFSYDLKIIFKTISGVGCGDKTRMQER